MVDHEDVTLGFWYIKDLDAKRNQPDAYIVVEVAKPYGAVEVCVAGTDKIHYVNEFEFIAPVPPPPKGN